MTGDDLALLDRLRAEVVSVAVAADDPEAVAAALLDHGGRRVPPAELSAWAEEADLLRRCADAVLAAEQVVAGAESFERGRRAALLASGATSAGADGLPAEEGVDGGDPDDGPEADRQAVRFALLVLVPSQLAGVAVYAADRTLVAVLAPAVALLGVLAVARAHRRPPSPSPPASAAGSADVAPPLGTAAEVPTTARAPDARIGSPAVRAAEAHLRRQEAAWKLAWWERGLAPVDVATWVGRREADAAAAGSATLVVVDEAAEVEDELLATMTAALPAAVRVVLIRPRPG